MPPPALSCVPAGIVYILLLLPLLGQVGAMTRTFYIGIVEEEWDYAPSGKNLITGHNISQDKDAAIFLESGAHRIGRIYKKAIYRQYTNSRYTEEIKKPAWLGFLGPIIKAEVEDTIIVHLKNFASRPYTLHPHGVFYKKDSEGAYYPDKTHKSDKYDDAVPPGGQHTYTWIVKQEYAPTSADPNCLTWIYHSHIDAPKDIASGLIGVLLTCKKGNLDSSLKRLDVDKEFALMFSVVDENFSWYLEENVQRYCSEADGVDVEDEDFQESNKMHAINGYMYGNLPTMDMCVGDSVSWHLFGIGNEVDVHSAFFHGNTAINQGHRTDVISLFPATFASVGMVPSTAGSWMLSCQVNDHFKAGMLGLYNVGNCGATAAPQGPLRKYFIAAEKVLWDYGPSKYNKFTGQALDDPASDSGHYFRKDTLRIGGSYWKVHYTEYTDETFSVKKARTEDEEHLGILGPVIKAEVGDTIVVVFKNMADHNYSIMAHGVSFNKDSEGAPYEDGSIDKEGSYVEPGKTFNYTWKVLDKNGPTDNDPNCLTYLYYSAADPVRDTNSGLVGPLLVCNKGSLHPDNTQVQIDKEFYLLFTIFDENLSWYLEENIAMASLEPEISENEFFQESNQMNAINGYMYGNLPGLVMCHMDNVSWHLLGLGTEVDIHAVHFQGNILDFAGTKRETFNVFPHTTLTVTMQAHNKGKFEVSCQLTDHHMDGMKNTYVVRACDNSTTHADVQYRSLRTYFIAVEEVEWDYCPDRSWELEKHNITENMHESPGHIFLRSDGDFLGTKYKKVVYREYRDSQFTEMKERSEEEKHLEILGPFIRAEVGDIIMVMFKNKATRPYSIYAHGVQMDVKDYVAEAAHPGETRIYRWNVPEYLGPGISDPDCVTWAYYSTANFMMDLYSGLVGPLLTCRKGVLDSQGRRKDVAREFALLFLVFDENYSWYLQDNIERHVNHTNVEMTEEFKESNKMHAINGKMYGNLHGLTMIEGEKTNWYLIGLGSEVDMHTVHFHAQSFIYKRDSDHRADVYDLFPGTFQTIELQAGNPGTWLLHCHVNDHIHAGMETTFTVKERTNDVPPPTNSAAPSGVPFLGKVLSVVQAQMALVSLLSIGLALLGLLVVVLLVLHYGKKKMHYNTVHNGSLPLYTI